MEGSSHNYFKILFPKVLEKKEEIMNKLSPYSQPPG